MSIVNKFVIWFGWKDSYKPWTSIHWTKSPCEFCTYEEAYEYALGIQKSSIRDKYLYKEYISDIDINSVIKEVVL